MHDEVLVGEFSHQAESFNTSAVANSAEILDELVRIAQPRIDERWLDAGCGPGIVSRALAPHVRELHGIDATATMVELARREAAARGLSNLTFARGDAAAIDTADGSWDGAVARFLLHHMPVPSRLFGELARVVRAGGKVVLADHLADEDRDAFAWAQEIERLRDPSHWASLPIARLHALGVDAGLRLVAERALPVELDFDDWLSRGSGGTTSAALIARALGERPGGTECFRINERHGRRTLGLRIWLSLWHRTS